MQAAASKQTDAAAAESAGKEKRAKTLCIATGLFIIAVTMVVPTRAPMIMQIKKGNASETARAMGLMTTFAAMIELVVNPMLGKLSDQYGRKPFMMMAAVVCAFFHSLVALVPGSMQLQFADRMISGSMIFAFFAPAAASMADLFAKDPARLGIWGATSGMYFGLGATIGPLVGSKLGGARSFFASGLAFLTAMLWVNTQLDETLEVENKKQFKLSAINPFAFLSLFKEKTLAWLAVTSALQSFGDYVNIYDINNLFMMKTLGYGPSQIGNFAMSVGVTQIVGGMATSTIVKKSSLKVAAMFANTSWIIGMALMANARNTPQAFLALFFWTFGHQRGNSVGAYMQKYGAKLDMGRAEIVAATGNLLAYVKVIIPLLYSNLFAWATTNGRNMPGLPYYVICVLTAVAQTSFLKAAPED